MGLSKMFSSKVMRGLFTGTAVMALSAGFLVVAPEEAAALCTGTENVDFVDGGNLPSRNSYDTFGDNLWIGDGTPNSGVANDNCPSEFGSQAASTEGNFHFQGPGGGRSLADNGGAVSGNFSFDQNGGNNNGYQNTGNVTDNEIFGNNNLYENNANLDDNFVSGSNSIRLNGDSGFTSTIEDNVVFGNSSLRANAQSAGAAVDLSGNFVVGNTSAFENAGDVTDNVIFGSDSGRNNGDNFSGNTIFGDSSGRNMGADFQDNIILGDNSGKLGGGSNVQENVIIGHRSGQNYGSGSMGNIVLGNDAGNGVNASYTAAIGDDTKASMSGGVAIGTDSTGAGAQSTQLNQMTLGTSMHTYTTPGITSAESLARQVDGPLEVVTSDQSGNLATDGGWTFNELADHDNRIDQNKEGVAIALALDNPDLKGDENFGVMVNWGGFEGTSAVGISAIGTIHQGASSRWALAGGVGFTTDGSSVGGRVGVGLTW